MIPPTSSPAAVVLDPPRTRSTRRAAHASFGGETIPDHEPAETDTNIDAPTRAQGKRTRFTTVSAAATRTSTPSSAVSARALRSSTTSASMTNVNEHTVPSSGVTAKTRADAAITPTPVVKRGRGRPRKTVGLTPVPTTSTFADRDASVTRGRGRPRNTPDDARGETGVQSVDDDVGGSFKVSSAWSVPASTTSPTMQPTPTLSSPTPTSTTDTSDAHGDVPSVRAIASAGPLPENVVAQASLYMHEAVSSGSPPTSDDAAAATLYLHALLKSTHRLVKSAGGAGCAVNTFEVGIGAATLAMIAK